MKKMLSACLCCRKKVPKNEFLGLEGMVKIKNPEENVENGEKSQQNTNSSTLLPGIDNDSKRASNAPHRSLPDIPVAESMINNDNGSELYATVADKVHEKPQGRSPTASLKKQTSVSQHSSISQADDVSSPYARVKTPPHDYDKVRPTEHPYAQLNTPGQGSSTYQPIEEDAVDSIRSRRGSNQSELGEVTIAERHNEIPAASAIAGMVSASQELPYMTPPIVQQPHFSGDSQDSSKGYTSITVREPLANLLAQTKRTHPRLISKEGNDSHYATVSDDSDEMYAAIDDPNNHGDIYTSGSETYAQIQPATANHVVVSVDINTTALRLHNQITTDVPPTRSNATTTTATNIRHVNETPVPPPVDSLRAQMHSRQASSSSNTSSVGILGSPKPEKRQANSPLPPTPKMIQFNSNSNLTSTSSSIPSGRNSVASVIDNQLQTTGKVISKENLNIEAEEDSPGRKSFNSPSKDIEGMYAKVMKKTKFSTAPSQNSSPVLRRKLSVDTMNNLGDIGSSDLVKVQASPGKSSIKSASYIENNYETIDKRRIRSNSYNSKDHGYETIRSDVTQTSGTSESKDKLESYAQINLRMKAQKKICAENPMELLKIDLNQTVTNFPSENLCSSSQNYEPGYESLPDKSLSTNDPGYETLLKTNSENHYNENKNPNSDYDPNYEVLRHQSSKYSGNSDDGYAKVFEKNSTNNDTDNDTVDGYSKVKERLTDETDVPGYSTISEKSVNYLRTNHDYASISDAKDKLDYSNKKSSNNNYSNLNQNNNNGNSNNNSNNNNKYNSNNSNHNNNSIKNVTQNEKSDLHSSEIDLYTNISNVRTHHLSLSSITPDDFTNSSSINYPNFSDTTGGENATTVSSTTNTTPLSSTRSSEKLMKTPSPVTGRCMSDRNDISTMMTSSTALLMMTNSIATTGTTTSTMMKRNSTSNTTISSCSLQQISTNSSSNYESLTGSESDPNYESVRFLDTENPYEPLQNDPNISPDVSGKNSFTNEDSYYSNTTGRNSNISHETPSPSTNSNNSKSPINNSLTNKSLQNNENTGQVDDYFQV